MLVENRHLFHTLVAFNAPVKGVPVGTSPPRWLPDGEKISKISLFVLAQLTNVTDGRTDTGLQHIYRAYA